MARTNYEQVTRTMEVLRDGLKPFMVRELEAHFGESWIQDVLKYHPRERDVVQCFKDVDGGDVKVLLEIACNTWQQVFRDVLGHTERSMVGELRDIRNAWAHQEAFSTDDVYRTMDTAHRLLQAVSSDKAVELERDKQKLLRKKFDEEARSEKRKTKQLTLEGTPKSGLTPWRELVTPHPDVASGNYQQAEFAADLAQVHRGEGTQEYADPRAFFRRTYITEGLGTLLKNGIRRMTGVGGDPVIELQTSFGGGKTHSMLALYHLFSGEPAKDMPGVEDLLSEVAEETGKKLELRAFPRAVLVGTAMSAGDARKKEKGITVRTLWGELAWQLLGKEGYKLLEESDKKGVGPGSEILAEIFKRTGGCIILIDEWVAYVRQTWNKTDIAGGSFDANITFAQSLTEAARAASNTILVASIPASAIEIGGEGGKQALDHLKHIFSRMESPWRPASAEESFEIVRRRLFENMGDPQLFKERDVVVDAFSELYRSSASEFPSECRERAYRRRMELCYPIHPELFDRLYTEWSSLDRFQRTRGVLRLMASVIHRLWENQDQGLMIMPCSVPIDSPAVKEELTRYLEDNWVPIIEANIDGPNSLPLRLDQENPNMGRYSACRRVARTIYMASAPRVKAEIKGTDDRQIRLGCVQPGEGVATFGDALRRLSDRSPYLYMDKGRYWFGTQPTVLSLARDRAAQQDGDDVVEFLKTRLRDEQKRCAAFSLVHACPAASSDVPDDYTARLVILGPEELHEKKNAESKAFVAAREIFENRGNAPRQYRNTLVFLVPDKRQMEHLDEAVRQHLAWKSILDDKGADKLNLDAYQAGQAETKMKQAKEVIDQRIPETYTWILAPYQEKPQSDLQWSELKPTGVGSLAERVAAKLTRDEALLVNLAGTTLRLHLDAVPLWRGDHVEFQELVEYFAKYPYLPRIQSPQILANAVQDGLSLLSWNTETFGWADSYDEEKGKYAGVRAGSRHMVTPDSRGLVLKPDVAQEAMELAATPSPPGKGGDEPGVVREGPDAPPIGPPEKQLPTRFYGAKDLDPTRMNRDADKVAEEVLHHLETTPGTRLRVTLQIEAENEDGIPEKIVRIVQENCNALRFEQHGFE